MSPSGAQCAGRGAGAHGDGAGARLVDELEQLRELLVADLLGRQLRVAADRAPKLLELDDAGVVAVVAPEELVPVLPPAAVRRGAEVVPHQAQPRDLVAVEKVALRDFAVAVDVHRLQHEPDARQVDLDVDEAVQRGLQLLRVHLAVLVPVHLAEAVERVLARVDVLEDLADDVLDHRVLLLLLVAADPLGRAAHRVAHRPHRDNRRDLREAPALWISGTGAVAARCLDEASANGEVGSASPVLRGGALPTRLVAHAGATCAPLARR